MLLASAQTLRKTNVAWVYVLACASDKVYVGFSRQLHVRLQQHFSGVGALFTRRYRPQRVLDFFPVKDERVEFETWVFYAEEFGMFRVGGFTQELAERLGYYFPTHLRRFKANNYGKVCQLGAKTLQRV